MSMHEMRENSLPDQFFDSIEDCASFCVKSQEIRRAVETILQNFYKKKYIQKCSETANEKKNEGNKKFKEKQYEESLSLYTESIFYANKDDDCLPLAYSNRSLVLQKMGYLAESLQDIEMAMATGYPEQKLEKLIFRKASCLVQLGNVVKAREVLVNSLKKPFSKEFIKSVNEEISRLENKKNEGKSDSEYELPALAGGENENFVNASNYVSVFYNKSRGRHVIATHDIERGDVLFVEKPFSFNIAQNNYCHGCCIKIIAPIPCWNCRCISYCSPKCRDEFWKLVHAYECTFSMVFQNSGIGHLGLRTVLTAASTFEELKKKLNEVDEFKPKEGVVQFRSPDFDRVYNLVTCFDKTKSVLDYAQVALLLTLQMKNYTNYFPANVTDDDLTLFVSVVLRFILISICNGTSLTENSYSKSHEDVFTGTKKYVIGVGIYSSASMMNHSCCSSIICRFHKNYLVCRALKRIKKGEEVFSCYGPSAKSMKRKQRQEMLYKQYSFKCECGPCLQKLDPMDMIYAFKCSKCKGPAILEEKNRENFICMECSHIFQVSKTLLKKEEILSNLYEEGRELFDINPNLALKKFLESWWISRDILYKFNENLFYSAWWVGLCLAKLGHMRKCIMFYKCSLLSAERRYSSFSSEVGYLLVQLGDSITFNLSSCQDNKARDAAAKEALRYYKEAQEIMNFFYPEEEEVKVIEKNKKILETYIKIKE